MPQSAYNMVCALPLPLLQTKGTVLYNKKPFSDFVVERTAAYVDQVIVVCLYMPTS